MDFCHLESQKEHYNLRRSFFSNARRIFISDQACVQKKTFETKHEREHHHDHPYIANRLRQVRKTIWIVLVLCIGQEFMTQDGWSIQMNILTW